MLVGQAIKEASTRLMAQSSTPRLDAELLLGQVLSRGRAWLRSHDDAPLNAAQQADFYALIVRRQAGEPVAYLVGEQEFWSLPLKVAPHTLIPRPDTELLVEIVLQYGPVEFRDVLDLGTGTGAIALALKAERPAWCVTAVDRVLQAVALARENAVRCELTIETIESDWYTGLRGRKFDVIVSNPPYIDENDLHLAGDGVRFEPLSALVAPQQGLADLQHIIDTAPTHLNLGGLLAVEHGFSQAKCVAQLFRQAGFVEIQTRVDLGNQPRVTLGFWRCGGGER